MLYVLEKLHVNSCDLMSVTESSTESEGPLASRTRSRNVAFSAQSTHVKISQLVASLQTSRQQVVFARFVTSCQQVWNKLLTTCNNLVDIIRLVTRLSQQGCYTHDITILLQPCNILVIS